VDRIGSRKLFAAVLLLALHVVIANVMGQFGNLNIHADAIDAFQERRLMPLPDAQGNAS
jgi:hypothetical protein